ncbi:MAG: hypothetical protein LBM69_03015 [Lachnospiraceae bacterium]|jgi:hypothetical protein|nr:hypothetical protein [Lachnospiraceae bacterium]
MGHYQNFKTVIYCVASGNEGETKESLQKEIAFFQKYVGVDKVYLEAYRDQKCSIEKLQLCKETLLEAGIEVSGGITSVVPNLSDEDQKRSRLFNTYCFSNEAMRKHWQDAVEYTASMFDEFIIDDFYFTQCTCEDCVREKGNRSWQEFRLAKMKEVSVDLTYTPAKRVNPNVKVIIKFPNWMESYQETGYDPESSRELFDMIYTGTETRHPAHTDQHLPRYLSYSLMRYMEHCAPDRNGGGWFDPFECYPIDCYLEQAYLTAFSKPKELMLFCWGALYQNKVVTPLGFQLEKIDRILSDLGTPTGLPVYLPFHAQGEDHLEDYLGMLGISFDPTPDFPESGYVFLTLSALADPKIIDKLKNFLSAGNHAIVTDGFVREALRRNLPITDLTSIRDAHRRMSAQEYHVSGRYHGSEHIRGERLDFPIVEHRNNASWSLINAGDGAQHASLLLRDPYEKGELLTLVLPDLCSDIAKLPRPVLNRIRREMKGAGRLWIDAPPQISLFTYDNDTFGIYSYAGDGAAPATIELHITGNAASITEIDGRQVLSPLYQLDSETVFRMHTQPGEFKFYKIG